MMRGMLALQILMGALLPWNVQGSCKEIDRVGPKLEPSPSGTEFSHKLDLEQNNKPDTLTFEWRGGVPESRGRRGPPSRFISFVRFRGKNGDLCTAETAKLTNKPGGKETQFKFGPDLPTRIPKFQGSTAEKASLSFTFDWSKTPPTVKAELTSAKDGTPAGTFTQDLGCDGISTIEFGHTKAKGTDPEFFDVKVGCNIPTKLTCGDDDQLRHSGIFDGWDTDDVQDIRLGNLATWEAKLQELPVGGGNNAAVGGATKLHLKEPLGVTVLYFKALAQDAAAGPSRADVKLIGTAGEECARIQGDVLGSERSWTASGTSSTTLLHKLQPTGPRKQYTRVELRSSWDAGQGAKWSLFLIAEGGKNQNRIIKPTGIAKACPNGVSKIEFLGTNVLYDDVQLTCSTKYPVAAPASGWGDPHFRNSFGGSFDFMGVPNKPYVLFDNGLVMVTALVERCNPGNPSVTCFSEVRASAYNHWPEEVVAKATKPGQPSKVQVAKLDFCSEVQRTFSWVDAVDGAPGGAAVLKVLGDDGEAELVHFTLTAYGFHGGRYISVNAKPQPALHFLGLRGLMFNSGKVWNELVEDAKHSPGKSVTFDESLVTVPWYAACMCESTENIEKGYCEDFQKRGAEVLQQEAGLRIPRAEDAEKRCGPDALSNARRCCRDLSGIPEYEAEYAQCVLDECEKPSGPSADCLESTTKALRFVDATGPVPLKLCPGNGNVVPDLVTGSCAPETGACREGWYPAGVCTARCVPEETCGGAPCSENGLCVCPDGKERHGVCPSEPEETCTDDSECGDGLWCRPTVQDGVCGTGGRGSCSPSLGVGEACGAHVISCAEKCDTGLLCTAIKKDGPKHCLPECGYLGCFHNSATWMRPAMSHPDMTHEMCRARCAESNMYGLSGTECFCGFRSHLEFPEIAHADEGECSSLCPGDPESDCGGEKTIGFYTHTCERVGGTVNPM